jgi:hypothetical protein
MKDQVQDQVIVLKSRTCVGSTRQQWLTWFWHNAKAALRHQLTQGAIHLSPLTFQVLALAQGDMPQLKVDRDWQGPHAVSQAAYSCTDQWDLH